MPVIPWDEVIHEKAKAEADRRQAERLEKWRRCPLTRCGFQQQCTVPADCVMVESVGLKRGRAM
jgi:hypothetical protein